MVYVCIYNFNFFVQHVVAITDNLTIKPGRKLFHEN